MMTNDSMTGLVNKLTGAGTDRDKITSQEWFYAEPNPQQLQNAYRSNWLCRKAVSIPTFDMLRQGWKWEGDESDARKIEKMERQFQVKKKVGLASTLASLYGGGAVLIGDGAGDPTLPLDVKAIRRGGLQYLTVLTRYEISSGLIDHDVMSPGHGMPADYTLSGGDSSAVTIHPSRLIRFTGAEPLNSGSLIYDVWGDSVLAGILKEIGGFATGISSTSRLLEESTVTYFKMKGLMERLSTETGTDLVYKALHLLQSTKSAINAVAVDSEDGDMDQFNANFAGLPEVIQMLLQTISGGSDIPLTRLLGQSPGGMNATGDSDTQNYYDRLKSEQEMKLRPPLEVIQDAIIASALGTVPDEIEMKFNPLWQMSEKEQAELDATNSGTITALNATGHVPGHVMEQVIKSMMIESPTFSAAKAAWDETDDEGDEDDDAETGQVAEANSINDSSPRPLYVRRNVLNGAEIVKWAKTQGFKTTLTADDLHVTIAFSRQAMDWHKAGQSYEESVIITSGGPRTLEQFGGGAVVLQFAGNSLKWRHEEIKEAGASWDHPEYSPHITITYDPGDVDLEKVTPYQGKIKLGPEIFQPLDEDWKDKIAES